MRSPPRTKPRSRSARVAAVLAAASLPALLAAAPASGDAVPHAAYLNAQWGLSAIGAPTAWQYGTGSGVRIGIVDTGVDFSQQDLQGKVVASTAIVSSPSSGCGQPQNAQDDNGHGTHVAGIAAASGAHGVDGVAPGASLVVAKVLDCQGSGTYQDVVAGIDWVVSQGARVVNLSLGDAGTGLIDQSRVTGNPLAGALQDAWNRGAIGVVAAGNNSNGLLGLGQEDFTNVPAVVVAATGPQGNLASYSNSVGSAEWGIAAPGGDDPNGPTTPTCGSYDPSEILSTFWTAGDPTACYATDEGTSMATPFVSGTLALLLARGLTPTQAVQTLLGTASHSVACGSACSGLLNAGAAMQSVAGRPAPTTNAAPAPPATAPSTAPLRHVTAAAAPTTSPAATSPTSSATGSSTTSTSASARAVRHLSIAAHPDPGGSAGWLTALAVVLGLGALGAAVALARRARSRRAATSL